MGLTTRTVRTVSGPGPIVAAAGICCWRFLTGLPLVNVRKPRRLGRDVHAAIRITSGTVTVGLVADPALTLSLIGLAGSALYCAVKVVQDRHRTAQAEADAAREPVRVTAWDPRRPLPELTAGNGTQPRSETWR